MNKILDKNRYIYIYIYLNKSKKSAFTLLEMLLVIAIIAILAGIVIIAINPGRQLAQARNAQRSSDLRALHSAVQQYYIDNRAWPTSSLSGTLQEICDESGEPSETCLNLNALVPTYLPAIPRDPSLDSTDQGTNYEIAINPTSLMPELTAPSSTEYELDPVQVGTTSLAINLVRPAGNPYTVPAAGLVAYWDMETTDNNVPDQSGNGNDGTVNGTVTFDEMYGIVGKGASFDGDGSGDYIRVGDNATLDFGTGGFTVCAWAKTAISKTGWDNVVGTNWDAASAIELRMNTVGESHFFIGSGTSEHDGGVIGNVINDGSWHLLCGIRDSNNTIYTNTAQGEIETDLTGDMTTTVDWAIGTTIGSLNSPPSDRYWDGEIDEVRIYNRVLLESEIQEIYNYGNYELNN